MLLFLTHMQVGQKRQRPYQNVVAVCNCGSASSLQYTVHTKRVPFDNDNEVSPYSLSPLSNKRYEMSHTHTLLAHQVFEPCFFDEEGFNVSMFCFL